MVDVGTEIVEVVRIARLIERHGEAFLDRTYSPAEMRLCRKGKDTNELFAALFACKEAALKALGLKARRAFEWREIEVVPDGRRVKIVFKGGVLEQTQGENIDRISASYSFTRQVAMATVVVERGTIPF